MNKILKALLMLVLLVNLTILVTINANPTVKFDCDAIDSYTPVETNDVYGVATINQTTIKSYNDRIISPTKLDSHKSTWLEPNVSLTNSDLRLVNYTTGSATNWAGEQPTDLARIYEKENPGWIVVGGINGDFFWITDNCEIQGTSMQEGNFYKPYDYNVGRHMAIGFKEDGTYVYGIADASDKQYVQVLGEDGKYQDVCIINDVDDTPTQTGVTLLTRFAVCPNPYSNVTFEGELPYDLSGYTIYKVKYETQRFDRDGSAKVGEHRVFVKGIITEIVSDINKLTINDADAESYLVTKDNSLATLSVGDTVRCQCKLEGEWADVTNITSAFNQVLTKGEVIDYTGVTDVATDYVNAKKNRTIMGFKEDGTPIMMVVEKNSYGASYEECGEILKGLGCVEGFLFDGGGSSCIFVRDNYGGFTTLNKHEDGRERSDGNAVLLVMRDPGFTISVDNIDRFSATVKLNITNQNYFNELTDIKLSIGKQTLDYNKDGVTFENLEESTKYSVKVSYSIKQHPEIDKVVKSAQTKEFTTRGFEIPRHGLSIENITHESITIKKDMNLSTSEWIQNVVVNIGKAKYSMGNANEFNCDGLAKDTEYEVFFEYTVVDPASGKEYPQVSTSTFIYTEPFCLPKIIKFEENRKSSSSLTIAYEYSDEDRIVENAYILVNGEKVKEISTKSGTTTINSLDFENNNYEVKLVLEYLNQEEKIQTIESNILEYKMPEVNPEPTPNPEKPKGGCGKKGVELFVSLMTASAVIGILLRKRK